MSWPGSHYPSPPNDFPPDHHIGQSQDVYFDPSFRPFDPHFRLFDPPLRQNDMLDYPYDGGVVDSNHRHPIEAPGHPFVNDPSTSSLSVPRLQENNYAMPIPKLTLVTPGTYTECDTVLPLPAGNDWATFISELHDNGIRKWAPYIEVDDRPVPGPLPRDVSTLRSSMQDDIPISRTLSGGNRNSPVLQTTYSGVNNSYNDSVSPQHHRGNIGIIIENLPYPLKSAARGWSGRASELVVQKMLGILETDIESMYQCNPSAWCKILEPLCGPKGKLCTVERKGPQGGVTSVTCNYNDCTQKFGHNPAEKIARHLICKHWGIHPFKCERCEYSSDYPQDCKRHQRTCEGM